MTNDISAVGVVGMSRMGEREMRNGSMQQIYIDKSGTKEAKEYNESALRAYKRSSIRTAKDLHYESFVITQIKEATSQNQVASILMEARIRANKRWEASL